MELIHPSLQMHGIKCIQTVVALKEDMQLHK